MSGDAGIESSKVLRILELSLTVFDTILELWSYGQICVK